MPPRPRLLARARLSLSRGAGVFAGTGVFAGAAALRAVSFAATTRVATACVTMASLTMACAGPPPPPPTAVIDATPRAVCEGDAFRTPVRLSGARSAAALSLAPAPPEPGTVLEYRWALEGAEHELIAGDLSATALTVRVAGDRPLHAWLTVRDEDGGEATSLRTVGVTLAPPPGCGDGCPAGTRCAAWDGEDRCLPDRACASDDECPPCHVCEGSQCGPG